MSVRLAVRAGSHSKFISRPFNPIEQILFCCLGSNSYYIYRARNARFEFDRELEGSELERFEETLLFQGILRYLCYHADWSVLGIIDDFAPAQFCAPQSLGWPYRCQSTRRCVYDTANDFGSRSMLHVAGKYLTSSKATRIAWRLSDK